MNEQAAPPAPPIDLPQQSKRGDEHLCAACAERPGEVTDDEGRLICTLCADPSN